MEQWFTLHTKPNAEYKVVTALEQRGLQTYLPEIKLSGKHQGSNRKPFFPCYLFIKIDLETVGLSTVRWTPGLRRVIAFDDQPVPLPEEVINLIQSQLQELETGGGQPAHPFKPGDTVRITSGPLQDMLAIFDGPTTPARRVQVLLNFLGQASRVQIDVTDLEKAEPDAEQSSPVKRARRTRGRGRAIKRQNQ